MIALGCRQDLMDNWLKESPTASIQSFYLVILLAAKLGIRLRSKEVTEAFLNIDLDEDERKYVLKCYDSQIETRYEKSHSRQQDSDCDT